MANGARTVCWLVKWDNSRNSTQKMRTIKKIEKLFTWAQKRQSTSVISWTSPIFSVENWSHPPRSAMKLPLLIVNKKNLFLTSIILDAKHKKMTNRSIDFFFHLHTFQTFQLILVGKDFQMYTESLGCSLDFFIFSIQESRYVIDVISFRLLLLLQKYFLLTFYWCLQGCQY